MAVQRLPEACADDTRRHLVGNKRQAKKDRYRKNEKKLTVICNTVTRKSGIGERKEGEGCVYFYNGKMLTLMRRASKAGRKK